MSDASVIIVAKSILANRGLVLRIIALSNDDQLKLHDGGENT